MIPGEDSVRQIAEVPAGRSESGVRQPGDAAPLVAGGVHPVGGHGRPQGKAALSAGPEDILGGAQDRHQVRLP